MHGLPMDPPVRPLRGTVEASLSGPSGELQPTLVFPCPNSGFPGDSVSSLASRASGAQVLLNFQSKEAVTENLMDSQSCWERYWTQ